MKVLPSPPAKPFYPENESDHTEIALTAGQLDDLLFPHLGQADLLQKGVDLPGRFGAGKPLERRQIVQIILHGKFRVEPELLRQIPQPRPGLRPTPLCTSAFPAFASPPSVV